MAPDIEVDGRKLVIKVGSKYAEYLFDEDGSETFNPVDAVEFVEYETGDLYTVGKNKVTVSIG